MAFDFESEVKYLNKVLPKKIMPIFRLASI